MSRAEEFATAVEQAFGVAPWRVERRGDGFTASLDIPRSKADPDPVADAAYVDDFTIDVTVQGAAGTFTVNSGRASTTKLDRDAKSLGHYERRVDERTYAGSRRTWSFKRTPDGLVPDPDDPRNTTAREQQVVSIGTSLGLTLDAASRVSSPGLVVSPSQKKLFVLFFVGFGAVLLVIGGVAAAILVPMFSR